MAELGWTTALRTAGIPQDYLDVTAIRRDWFDRDVRHIDSGTPGRIEVLRRVPRTEPDSQSVQHTLHDMGEAVLRHVDVVESIHLVMPNRHHLPVDLSPFGLENRNEIFVATTEPYGLIEATIAR